MMNISLQEMKEIFNERINGRCVTIGFNNCNASCPLTFDNIEMVLYKNGDMQFCEQDEEAHYSPIFKSENIDEIMFDDSSFMSEFTGGQFFIYFKNGDCLDINADF